MLIFVQKAFLAGLFPERGHFWRETCAAKMDWIVFIRDFVSETEGTIFMP